MKVFMSRRISSYFDMPPGQGLPSTSSGAISTTEGTESLTPNAMRKQGASVISLSEQLSKLQHIVRLANPRPLFEKNQETEVRMNDPLPSKAVFAKEGELWDLVDGKSMILRYTFIDEQQNVKGLLKKAFTFSQTERQVIDPEQVQQTKVRMVLERFLGNKVPGVTFLHQPKGYAEIRISFDPKHGGRNAWSEVGRDALRVKEGPTMYLGCIDGKPQSLDDFPSSKDHQTIQHEALHALGCYHEHQSPNCSIALNKGHLKNECYSGVPDQELCNEIIQKRNKEEVGFASEYDPKSIMHYDLCKDCIIGYEGEDIYNREPSELDLAWLNIMYPPPIAQISVFEHSLDVAGIKGEKKREILGLYEAKRWSKIRNRVMKQFKEHR